MKVDSNKASRASCSKRQCCNYCSYSGFSLV